MTDQLSIHVYKYENGWGVGFEEYEDEDQYGGTVKVKTYVFKDKQHLVGFVTNTLRNADIWGEEKIPIRREELPGTIKVLSDGEVEKFIESSDQEWVRI